VTSLLRRALVAVLLGSALAGCGSSPGSAASGSSRAATSSAAGTSSAPGSSQPPASPPPADPDGLSPAQADAVTAALGGMDRRAQVAQLFVVGVPLSGLSDGDPLAGQGVGGIFVRGRSAIGAGDLAAVTARWSRLAPGVRPWVATDQEGGQVQALAGPGFPRLPAAVDQGQLPAPQLAALADGLGADLAAAGLTLDLAPVADVVPAGTEAGNAPIGAFGRQYGSTPAAVVAAAGAVVTGLGAHGVTAAVKHFPGLGSVTGNTDDTAGVTDTTTTADGPQVGAFGTLARAPEHPFVMVSSAIYRQIDGSSPAVFSPTVVTGVLRGQLGFRGVVITDDVGQAAAVQDVPAGERAVRFLAAGGTLVLTVQAAPLPAMIDAVLARDGSDPAFAATVDDAVRTALVAKARAGLLGPT
jgi:beta-glucosidase-like glycosyl hydrolase